MDLRVSAGDHGKGFAIPTQIGVSQEPTGQDECTGRRLWIGVFKKQGVYWIDRYASGHRKRIGPDKRMVEMVLQT
jgi:hypothetical protein